MTSTVTAMEEALYELCDVQHVDRNIICGITRGALGFAGSRAPIEEFPVGATRIGGMPDLPVVPPGEGWRGTSWPTIEEQPMNFLAQFNLADLAGYASAAELPKSGLLSVFAALDARHKDLKHSYNWNHRANTRILYTPAQDELIRPSGKFDTPEVNLYNTCRLRFFEQIEIPHPGSVNVAKHFVGDEQYEVYRNFWYDWTSKRKFALERSGGRRELGFFFGYEFRFNGYDNPEAGPAGGGVKLEDCRHLVSFNSSDDVPWMFWDLGILSFHISRQDLAVHDFSNCWSDIETT
jgi:uncharacterized protein YwqG